MKKIFLLPICLTFALFIQSRESLYKKNLVSCQSDYEEMLVNHTIDSFSKAIAENSKLSGTAFSREKSCHHSPGGVIPYYHLLNNICALQDASHLHVGLYTGGSFVSALYGNESLLKDKIGVDWYSDDAPYGHKNICYSLCQKYLSHNYNIVIGDCFAVDKSQFKNPIDIYLYDADHSTMAHKMAFTYYNEILADVFITIVDDWNWEQVRDGTFEAFDELNYHILYENVIPADATRGNGQYIAVIKK